MPNSAFSTSTRYCVAALFPVKLNPESPQTPDAPSPLTSTVATEELSTGTAKTKSVPLVYVPTNCKFRNVPAGLRNDCGVLSMKMTVTDWLSVAETASKYHHS
jgi:hypothetical protein